MTITHKVERSTPWTEDRMAYAAKMWRDGKSASEIALALNKSFGVLLTRNSVIGKLHRMGVMQKRTKRPVTLQKEQHNRGERIVVIRKPAGKPPVVRIPLPDIQTPHAGPWQQRRSGQCTWPIATDDGTFSCCSPIERGSFCGPHSAIGYDTVRKLDVDRAARHMARFDRVEAAS